MTCAWPGARCSKAFGREGIFGHERARDQPHRRRRGGLLDVELRPQLVKIWRERDASSVSLNMYLVTITGFALWTAYGVFIGKWPLVAANAVCLMMSGAVVALKVRFDGAKGRGAGRA